MGFSNLNQNTQVSNNTGNVKTDGSTSAFQAGGTLMATDNAWLGLTVDNSQTNVKTKITGTTNTERSHVSATTLSPTAAIAIDSNVILGAAFSTVSIDVNNEVSDDYSANYGRFTPSAIYHDAGMEVGVVYTPTINIREDAGSVQQAGSTSLFGQFALSPLANLGGAVTQLREADLDGDTRKNVIAYKLAAEGKAQPHLTVGGAMEFKPESAKNAESRSVETMPTMKYSVFTSLHRTTTRNIGANVSYLSGMKSTGKDATSGESYRNAQSGMSLAVAGTMLF